MASNLANIPESLAAQAELEHHQEPLDPVPEVEGELPMEEDGENDGPRTYAQATVNTWILELHLVREDKGWDFHITKPELGRLIFKRLLVPAGGLVSYDDSYFKKIVLELKSDVRADQLNVTQALEVRKGKYFS